MRAFILGMIEGLIACAIAGVFVVVVGLLSHMPLGTSIATVAGIIVIGCGIRRVL